MARPNPARLHPSGANARLTLVIAACHPPLYAAIQTGSENAARIHDSITPARRQGAVCMSAMPNPERQREVDLLARVAEGDEQAFAQFYQRCADGLYGLALKMMNDSGEAEDVLQDGFSYMWKKAATYDPARSSPFTWAVMIVRNKAIDRLRSRQRQARIVEKATTEFLHFTDVDNTSAREPVRREQCAEVRAALAEIPGDQKQVVELAFFGGLTHGQIAERLEAPLGTIKARIRRGLLKMRDHLKGVGA